MLSEEQLKELKVRLDNKCNAWKDSLYSNCCVAKNLLTKLISPHLQRLTGGAFPLVGVPQYCDPVRSVRPQSSQLKSQGKHCCAVQNAVILIGSFVADLVAKNVTMSVSFGNLLPEYDDTNRACVVSCHISGRGGRNCKNKYNN